MAFSLNKNFSYKYGKSTYYNVMNDHIRILLYNICTLYI